MDDCVCPWKETEGGTYNMTDSSATSRQLLTFLPLTQCNLSPFLYHILLNKQNNTIDPSYCVRIKVTDCVWLNLALHDQATEDYSTQVSWCRQAMNIRHSIFIHPLLLVLVLMLIVVYQISQCVGTVKIERGGIEHFLLGSTNHNQKNNSTKITSLMTILPSPMGATMNPSLP